MNAHFVPPMKSPRSLGWLRCGAGFLAGLIVVWSVIAADAPKPATPAPTTPLSGLVEKFTEKRPGKTALPTAQPAAQPTEQPNTTAVSPEHAATKAPPRKPSPPLASLPAPKAASGPLRILIVDDDWDNNAPGATDRLTASDEIFRTLVAAAVYGNAAAWSVVIADRYKDGPGIERLRGYNVILWYTGASYGADPSGVSTLSREDEKTVRRYLEEVGGSFILVSPGYVNNLSYATSWTDSPHPFLKEVVGVNGLAGFVRRGAGTVQAYDGENYNVQGKGAPEALFSAVNPDGAAVVFTSKLDPKKTAESAVPVATAHPYGSGRFVYVGFTFENIAEEVRKYAFNLLLRAAVEGTAAPDATGTFAVQVSGTPVRTVVSWALPSAAVANASLSGPAQTARKAPATPAAPPAGPTVTVERQVQSSSIYGTAGSWQRMVVPSGASEVVDEAAAPGSTQSYRVTVTDANGATSSREVQYTVPSFRDPESMSASLQSDYSVILTWPEVPGVTKYRVQQGPGAQGIEPTVVSGATEWRSPPMDGFKRSWLVTSLYERDGEWVSLTGRESWPGATTEGIDQYFLVVGTFTIQTGNDNKELLSDFTIKLTINGGASETGPDGDPNPDPLRLQEVGSSFGSSTAELKVNSSADFPLSTGVDTVWLPQKNNLANIQQHGLRIAITYHPNFPLDAWKIDSLTLTLKFQDRDQITNYAWTGRRSFYPGMDNKVITFSNVSKLLTARNPRIDLITDGSLRPIVQP
jgi:hypothetical protein